MVKSKLLLIGLDAADQRFIRQHLSVLPNIARFFREAEVHPLEAEPLSGAVWGSFATRSRPGAHGLYHHLQWNPERMRIERSHPRWIGPLEPFWRDMAKRGLNVTAFDVPFVFPGAAGGAIEIANWGSHDLVGPFWCSDPAEERRIRARYGGHPMGFEIPLDKSVEELARIRDQVVAGAAKKADVAVELMARPWDLFILVFGETHRAGHVLWPHSSDEGTPIAGALLDVYRAVDAAIGRVIAAAGSDCDIILFALHGMGPNSSQSHLSREMLLRALGASAERPAVNEATSGFVHWLRRNVPARAQYAIAEAVPTFVRDFVVARDIAGGLDWHVTRAFSLEGDLAGYWRLNVTGREAGGILSDQEAERLRVSLAEALQGFALPDGRRLVKRLHFPARDGAGARAHLLPDIVAEWDPEIGAADEAYHPRLGRVRGHIATGRGGNHAFNGFYAHLGSRVGSSPPRHISELGRLAEALTQKQ